MADFELISKRILDEWHYKIFRWHFLLGADWKLCCDRLGVDRGNYFHAVYRIEEQAGRAFYETEPYGLYPPREYFSVQIQGPMEPCHPQQEPPQRRARQTLRTQQFPRARPLVA
jgi:hypothetical protein